MENNIRIVILAAGKGTRMKSDLPKALASLNGKPMIKHLLESVEKAGIDKKPVIVVGYEKDLVIKELGDKYEYVIQKEQLGTGHAVMTAREAVKDAEHIIVISGDQPFIKPESLRAIADKHISSLATITITTTLLPNFEDWRKNFIMYGRIIRQGGKIIDREYKDASPEEKEIKEINVSCYAFKAKWLWNNIQTLDSSQNSQKEYYLTDLWEKASEGGEKVASVQIEPLEALGANSKEELEILEKLMVK